MEELWTPWRMRYILANKDVQGCIFCDKPREQGHHQFILHRGPLTFVMLNLYPYTVGHLMVIPYRHLPRLSALTSDERRELAQRLAQCESILRRVAGAGWFHVGMNLDRAAGAGVEGHLHVHLVPRETSSEWSQPGTELKDPPAPIEETYGQLLPNFVDLS